MILSSRIRMQDHQENPGMGFGRFPGVPLGFLQDGYSVGNLQISNVWPRRRDRARRGDPAGFRSRSALEFRASEVAVWIFVSFGKTLSMQEISMDTTATSALFDDIALADRYSRLCEDRVGSRTACGEAVLFDDIQALSPVAGMRPDTDGHAAEMSAVDSGSEPIDRDPRQSDGQESRQPCRAVARRGQGGSNTHGSRMCARNLSATARAAIDGHSISPVPRAVTAHRHPVRLRDHAAPCRGPPARQCRTISNPAMHPGPSGAGMCSQALGLAAILNRRRTGDFARPQRACVSMAVSATPRSQ